MVAHRKLANQETPCSVAYQAGDYDYFDVPFGFLRMSDLKVYIGGVKNLSWQLSSNRQKVFLEAANAGDKVVISRHTNADELYISFTDGSMLTAKDINQSLKQLLFLIQERINDIDPSVLTHSLQDLLKALDNVVKADSNNENHRVVFTTPTIEKSNLSQDLQRIINIVNRQILNGSLVLRSQNIPVSTQQPLRQIISGGKWDAEQKPIINLPAIVDTGTSQDTFAATVEYVKRKFQLGAATLSDANKIFAVDDTGTAGWRRVPDVVSLTNVKEIVNSNVAKALGDATSNENLYARIAPIDYATGSMKIPAGTNDQKTTTPPVAGSDAEARSITAKTSLPGRIRCNTSDHSLEYNDGTGWHKTTSMSALGNRILGTPGDTRSRPRSPTASTVRINTESNRLEFYNGTRWEDVGTKPDPNTWGRRQIDVPTTVEKVEFLNIPVSATTIYIAIQAVEAPETHFLMMRPNSTSAFSKTGIISDGYAAMTARDGPVYPWSNLYNHGTHGDGDVIIACDSGNRTHARFYGLVTMLRTDDKTWHISSQMQQQRKPPVRGATKLSQTQGEITLPNRLKYVRIWGIQFNNNRPSSASFTSGHFTMRWL